MGRKKKDPTKTIRVPLWAVDKIETALPVWAAERRLMPGGPHTEVEKRAVDLLFTATPEEIGAGAVEYQTGLAKVIGDEVARIIEETKDARVTCPQCDRAVPDLRYRGRQHTASCSRFDKSKP